MERARLRLAKGRGRSRTVASKRGVERAHPPAARQRPAGDLPANAPVRVRWRSAGTWPSPRARAGSQAGAQRVGEPSARPLDDFAVPLGAATERVRTAFEVLAHQRPGVRILEPTSLIREAWQVGRP